MDAIKNKTSIETPIEEVFRLLPPQKSALKKLGVKTVQNLLFHFPVRYTDVTSVKLIKDLLKGEQASIYGKISKIELTKGFRTKIPMAKAIIEDQSGKINAVWFHQPYIAKMIVDGSYAKFTGHISESRKGKGLYISNPEFEQTAEVPIIGDSLFEKGASDESHPYPVYPESRGITSKWFYHAVQKILRNHVLESLTDPIPEYILKKYNLPTLHTALILIHTPKNP